MNEPHEQARLRIRRIKAKCCRERNVQKRGRPASLRSPVIVVEHSAEAASASDWSVAVGEIEIRENEHIADTLSRLFGRKMLSELATIVTPETLLSWHRKLIADKYDAAPRSPNLNSFGCQTATHLPS